MEDLGAWGMGVRGINQGYHTEIAFKTLQVLTSSPVPQTPGFSTVAARFLGARPTIHLVCQLVRTRRQLLYLHFPHQ